MMRWGVVWAFALIAILTGCSRANEEPGTLAETLPLDAERLTFVFFFADP